MKNKTVEFSDQFQIGDQTGSIWPRTCKYLKGIRILGKKYTKAKTGKV